MCWPRLPVMGMLSGLYTRIRNKGTTCDSGNKGITFAWPRRYEFDSVICYRTHSAFAMHSIAHPAMGWIASDSRPRRPEGVRGRRGGCGCRGGCRVHIPHRGSRRGALTLSKTPKNMAKLWPVVWYKCHISLNSLTETYLKPTANIMTFTSPDFPPESEFNFTHTPHIQATHKTVGVGVNTITGNFTVFLNLSEQEVAEFIARDKERLQSWKDQYLTKYISGICDACPNPRTCANFNKCPRKK